MPLGHVQRAVVIRRHAKTFCKTPPRELQLTLGRRLVHLQPLRVLRDESTRKISVVRRAAGDVAGTGSAPP